MFIHIPAEILVEKKRIIERSKKKQTETTIQVLLVPL